MDYTYQLFEDITSDTVRDVATFLRVVPGGSNVTLDIVSYGGEIFPSIAVIQMIQVAQKFGTTFTAKVWGLAASSAADIALACDRIEMGSTSSIMIHSAWVVDTDESRKHDKGIEIANQAQLEVIRKRLPEYSEKDLREDRWFTASEALAVGLVDAIFDVDDSMIESQIAAKYILKHNGGLKMDEVKKEDSVVEEVQEIKEEIQEVEEQVEKAAEEEKKEEQPDIIGTLDAMVKRIAELDERMKRIEEAKAACGDDQRKENARLKAIFDRISAVCAPACEKVEPISAKEQDATDPKEDLEKCKATYGSFKKYIDQD